jgi:secreted PhoX family phosphatase
MSLRAMTITDHDPGGLSRHGMLSRSAASLGIVLSGSVGGLFGTTASPAPAHHRHARRIGYGPLVDDPAGLLSLPEGFEYKIVAQSGVTKLETGEPTPSDPDGTASFVRRGGNGSVLINNHERQRAVPGPAHHRRRAARRRSRSTATATASASTSASPARTPTAPAAARRGTPG